MLRSDRNNNSEAIGNNHVQEKLLTEKPSPLDMLRDCTPYYGSQSTSNSSSTRNTTMNKFKRVGTSQVEKSTHGDKSVKFATLVEKHKVRNNDLSENHYPTNPLHS
jgi:hypothetical protein